MCTTKFGLIEKQIKIKTCRKKDTNGYDFLHCNIISLVCLRLLNNYK
jgi:hypothetical protein